MMAEVEEVPKGVFLECIICTLDYGLEPDRKPRVLNCGHTFCHTCLKQCLRNDAIQCPFCAAITEVIFAEVSRIPINFSILDMLAISKIPQEEPDAEMCEVCNKVPPTVICVSCSPMGVKFCDNCNAVEHNRSFKPVQLHRRIPLSDFDFNIVCSRHTGTLATHYSPSLNQFACIQCQTEPDWNTKCNNFLQIVDAAEHLRVRSAKVNFNCNSTMRQLHDTQKELDMTIMKLASSASEAKLAITNEFQRLSGALQQRQQKLIRHVEQEYESRKESLEQQKTQVSQTYQALGGHHEQLKSLLQRSNQDFLRGYHHVMEGLNAYIGREDSSLLRIAASGDIPCFFRNRVEDEVKSHGAVGGGPVPKNIICQRFPLQQSTLPQLSWSLPQFNNEVTQYEVEYEHMPDERPPSPNNSGPLDQEVTRPPVVPKSGKAQAHIMNDLIPGCRYRFRVRSRSIAGWGMWSYPITGRFDGFPVQVGHTGEKVSIKVPADGEYRITAAGAKAADGKKFKGGRGAVISAVFTLQAYDRIEVAVGGMSQMGTEGHSGGGGGTFVLLSNYAECKTDNLLVVAGGGGGTRGYDDQDEDGADASLETYGTDGRGNEHGDGGKEGLPGTDANYTWFQGPCWGHGGAGFTKSSKTAKCYSEGLEGGQCGGYGGGGAVGLYGGGGGGGYSGGGGGRGGGGGGSYVKKTGNTVTKKIGNEGDGYVRIERIAPQNFDPLINMSRKEDINGCGNSSTNGGSLNSPASCNSSGNSSPASRSPQNSQLLN